MKTIYLILTMALAGQFAQAQVSRTVTADLFKSSNLTKTWTPPTASGTLSATNLAETFTGIKTLITPVVSGGSVNNASISSATITNGSIAGAVISGGSVSSTISNSLIQTSTILGGTISGASVIGGSVSGSSHIGGSFSAPTITSGSISGTAIASPTITLGTASGVVLYNPIIIGGSVSGVSGVSSGTVSGWTTYTTGCNGSWTVNTNYTCQKRQVGTNYEYEIVVAPIGPPNVAALIINIPDTIDAAKIISSVATHVGNGIAVDFGVDESLIYVAYNGTSSVRVRTINTSGTYSSSNALSNTVPYSFNTNDQVWVRFTVPIVGL